MLPPTGAGELNGVAIGWPKGRTGSYEFLISVDGGLVYQAPSPPPKARRPLANAIRCFVSHSGRRYNPR
jgi:hypothetical protein